MSEDSQCEDPWIESTGGPLIAIPHSLMRHWEGSAPPSARRTVEASFRCGDPDAPATDYDRACDVEEYVASIPVGTGQGLVLGDEPAPTRFVRTPRGGVLVRWICAESDEDVEARLGNLPTSGFEDESCSFRIEETPVRLFDCACNGDEVEESLVLDLSPGVYDVSTCRWEPDEETTLLLHRLEPSGESAR